MQGEDEEDDRYTQLDPLSKIDVAVCAGLLQVDSLHASHNFQPAICHVILLNRRSPIGSGSDCAAAGRTRATRFARSH